MDTSVQAVLRGTRVNVGGGHLAVTVRQSLTVTRADPP
jgi:hypothetical protein